MIVYFLASTAAITTGVPLSRISAGIRNPTRRSPQDRFIGAGSQACFPVHVGHQTCEPLHDPPGKRGVDVFVGKGSAYGGGGGGGRGIGYGIGVPQKAAVIACHATQLGEDVVTILSPEIFIGADGHQRSSSPSLVSLVQV